MLLYYIQIFFFFFFFFFNCCFCFTFNFFFFFFFRFIHAGVLQRLSPVRNVSCCPRWRLLPMRPVLHSIVRNLAVIASAVSALPPPSPCSIFSAFAYVFLTYGHPVGQRAPPQ